MSNRSRCLKKNDLGMISSKDSDQPGNLLSHCLEKRCPNEKTVPVQADPSFRWVTNEPRHEKTNFMVLIWSDTNWAVQPQKMARGLKF